MDSNMFSAILTRQGHKRTGTKTSKLLHWVSYRTGVSIRCDAWTNACQHCQFNSRGVEKTSAAHTWSEGV